MATIILSSEHDAPCFLRPRRLRNFLSFETFIILFFSFSWSPKIVFRGKWDLKLLDVVSGMNCLFSFNPLQEHC